MSTHSLFVFAALGLAVICVVGTLTLLWFKDRDGLKELMMVAWLSWLLVGWAPTIFVMVTATSATQAKVGLGVFVAYLLAWVPIAASA